VTVTLLAAAIRRSAFVVPAEPVTKGDDGQLRAACVRLVALQFAIVTRC
jgi:hypothetical protein